MGVPDHLLPHTVTIVRPVLVPNAHGNATPDYGEAASRTTIQAWLQQDTRQETRSEGREAAIQAWLMVTNHADVLRGDRAEYGALTFDVEGPPEPVFTPAGFHHVEATLRVVDG